MKYFNQLISLNVLSLPLSIVLITLIAFLLRVSFVGSNPPALSWDEVAWGYNAYALGHDGRDEFGRFLPLTYLESYGDYKPPVYAYLAILPIKLFGLTELATRFPSVVFGTLTVFVTYFLVKRLFSSSPYREYYALASAGILALSPWHINLSRAAFEANIATFMLVAGVWAYLAGIQEKKWYLLFSAVFFSLSLYTFNTSRVVAPILVGCLVLGTWKYLWERKRQTMLAALLGLLLVLPTVPFLLSPQAGLRFKEVNIFSDISVIEQTNQEIANDHNAWYSKILHNRRFAYAVLYMQHYLDNFNPSFLFIQGDENRRFSTQDVGEMYLWDLPFFILGIGILFRKRESMWWIIPIWLLVGIIPAATARETPHALRIETTLPTFQILTAIGVVTVLLWLRQWKRKKEAWLVIGLMGVTLAFTIGIYLHGYYSHYPREYSSEWQYGYKAAVLFAKNHEEEYDHIYVTDKLGRPYIYFLFYQHIDPAFFRATATVSRDSFGFVKVQGFGKYHFGDIAAAGSKESGKKLYISTADEVPPMAKKLQTFDELNGQPILVAYTL